MCCRPKTKRTTQTVISNKSKSQALRWYEALSLPLAKLTYAPAMAALLFTEILEQHVLPFPGTSMHFFLNETMQNPILHRLQGPGCRRTVYRYWAGRPATPDPSVSNRERGYSIIFFQTKMVATKTPHCCTC